MIESNRFYYELPFARAALSARLAAVSDAVPPQAAVLDLGCNDATVSRHLLRTGRARRVLGIDSALLSDPPPGMDFLRANVRNLRLRELGQFDIVLALNLLHHVVDESVRAARALVLDILACGDCALVDMGSFSERGEWGWRRTFDRHWSDDEFMWDELFAGAVRTPLLSYSAMGGGRRVLWRLTGRS